MTTHNSDLLPTLLLLVALVPALWLDVRYRKLPNWLTFSLFLTGLLINSWLAGFSGLLDAIGGGMLALVLLLPLYLWKKGMGAGDVKMVAAIGAVLGVRGGLLCTALILVAGSVIGLMFLFYKGGLLSSMNRYRFCILSRSWLLPQINDAASLRFPYAFAITAGVLITLYWSGNLELLGTLFF